jgi:hypothetical protein
MAKILRSMTKGSDPRIISLELSPDREEDEQSQEKPFEEIGSIGPDI